MTTEVVLQPARPQGSDSIDRRRRSSALPVRQDREDARCARAGSGQHEPPSDRLAVRRFITAAALALALVTFLAAITPLATKAASIAPPPAMSRALFLCRTRHGIDETCAAALASALINEQSKHDATAVTAGAGRACHLDPRTIRRIAAGSKANQINRRAAESPQRLGAETVR
jgi:hypothetical protein